MLANYDAKSVADSYIYYYNFRMANFERLYQQMAIPKWFEEQLPIASSVLFPFMKLYLNFSMHVLLSCSDTSGQDTGYGFSRDK